jgi:hypothetical protein
MMFRAAVAAMVVCWGSSGRLHGQGLTPDLLASYHFVGGAQLSSRSDSTALREIIGLPQSHALARYVLDRLAQAPQTLFPDAIDATQAAKGKTLLREMLDDLFPRESFLDVRGRAGTAPGWIFGIALSDERAALWQANLSELMALWKLGTPDIGEAAGLKVTTVKAGQGATVVRWTRTGEWLLLGVGGERFEAWDLILTTVRQSQRPRPTLAGEWLNAEFNLARWATPAGLPKSMVWPQVKLSAAGREADVRLTSSLVFAEDMTGPLDPWQIPTNIIQEPLISFTAWRGARPWLSRSDLLARLGVAPAPNEIYFWAQSLSVPQSLVAFPSEDPTNRVKAMLAPALEMVPASWRERGLGQIEWQEEAHQLVWKSLPLLYPHLRPGQDGGRGFITGGLFPALQTTNAPPQELLNQFSGKPDLVYYNWEITARRLMQLRLQLQLAGMVSGKAVLLTNSPALPWLIELEQRLGNSATEVVAVSPRQWSLTRRSPIGLTATEIAAALCWFDSLDFPKLTLRLPDRPVPTPNSKTTRKR